MASDLGLHYLPISHKKDTRLVWVKHRDTHIGRQKLENYFCSTSQRILCVSLFLYISTLRGTLFYQTLPSLDNLQI